MASFCSAVGIRDGEHTRDSQEAFAIKAARRFVADFAGNIKKLNDFNPESLGGAVIYSGDKGFQKDGVKIANFIDTEKIIV